MENKGRARDLCSRPVPGLDYARTAQAGAPPPQTPVSVLRNFNQWARVMGEQQNLRHAARTRQNL